MVPASCGFVPIGAKILAAVYEYFSRNEGRNETLDHFDGWNCYSDEYLNFGLALTIVTSL